MTMLPRMSTRTRLTGRLAAALVLSVVLGSAAAAQDEVEAPASEAEAEASAPDLARTPVFASTGADTLRSNLWVAEALLNTSLGELLPALPPPPAAVLLIPGSTDAPSNLLTAVATSRLQQEGYTVHLDRVPDDTELQVVELRYRISKLELSYPAVDRRLGLWKSWVDRQMHLAAQFTMVDRGSGQVLSSKRLSRTYQDRFPHRHLAAVEASDGPAFTRALPTASGWTRRLEEVVVLGTLVGLVAIYFANTE